jgi:hypothetical protein
VRARGSIGRRKKVGEKKDDEEGERRRRRRLEAKISFSSFSSPFWFQENIQYLSFFFLFPCCSALMMSSSS